jgi:pimeloyl-ACP methyl ester carboxylesterase
VPLDYRQPRGKKISLAVSRVRHRSSHYQGVMLVNPGGPGGSGLALSYLGSGPYVPGTADDDYDWIGFDPRGVGQSRPMLTCDASYFHYNRPSYVPRTRMLVRTWLGRSRGYAHDCATSRARELLPHVKTVDNARDMESLRKALGRDRISYYGFSYGTYLGAVYATLFPHRVRRFVLDSNVDPRGVWYRNNLRQDIAFDRNIKIYFDWLAKHDDVYHLGTDGATIERDYYAELRKLDRHPAGGIIGPDELTDTLLYAGYFAFLWEDLSGAYAALVNHGDYSGIKQWFDDLNPHNVPGADNGYAMYLATGCTDARWPQQWSTWARDNWRIYRQAPFATWGNAWFNAPCLYWTAKPGRPVDVSGRQVKVPILLFDETLDAATPFAGSLEIRSRFPTASLVAGVGGTTHAATLSGVACVDNAVARYLANGQVPERLPGRRADLGCPALPQPDPEPSASGSTGSSAGRALVPRQAAAMSSASRIR